MGEIDGETDMSKANELIKNIEDRLDYLKIFIEKYDLNQCRESLKKEIDNCLVEINDYKK